MVFLNYALLNAVNSKSPNSLNVLMGKILIWSCLLVLGKSVYFWSKFTDLDAESFVLPFEFIFNT